MILAWHRNAVSDGGHSADVMKKNEMGLGGRPRLATERRRGTEPTHRRERGVSGVTWVEASIREHRSQSRQISGSRDEAVSVFCNEAVHKIGIESTRIGD